MLDENFTAMQVTIMSIDDVWFPYKIPLFPVITLNLQKITFKHDGQVYNGLVNKDVKIQPGEFICTSHCNIKFQGEDFTVLWVLSPSDNKTKDIEQHHRQSLGDPETNFKGKHTLPFKVMGTCYWPCREEVLEEASQYLNEYNRPVYVDLVEEPENVNDSNAIAVYIMVSNEFNKVGYIARELTCYLKPILKTLDVSVKAIRFSTTYYTMGFYITIEITKQGMWHKKVIEASKSVK